MFADSKAGQYSMLIDRVYHSTLGLSVVKKKTKKTPESFGVWRDGSKWSISSGGREIQARHNRLRALATRAREVDVLLAWRVGLVAGSP